MGATVRVKAATTEPKGECPACGYESMRVHSRYERCLSDLSVAGQEVLLQVRVRASSATTPPVTSGPSPSRCPALPAGTAGARRGCRRCCGGGAGSGRASRCPSYRAPGLCGGPLDAAAAVAELAGSADGDPEGCWGR
ncbi:transposase family protein [Nonomuraea polychroma]|uniref:transposase family protein n=1 Tax=Nonomuraea polychroma TaxID=46176 RepID=UPI003BACA966